MTIAILVFNLLFQSQAHASKSPASIRCDNAAIEFNNRFTALEKRYLRYSKQAVRFENKPTWTASRTITKNSEAVYLLHGFIGTPEEMSTLAQSLAAKNYTVINDIIPGYGSDARVANAFDAKSWQQHVNANLNLVRSCFKKVHLVGFSTGGLLLHQYLRANPQSAASVVLYSPFYESHSSFLSFVGAATRFLTSTVSTKLLYRTTGFPDIRVAVLKPDNYLQEIPLDAALAIQELGEKLSNEITRNALKFRTPVLLFVSDADRVMNLDSTVRYINADFATTQIIRYEKAPHHLMVAEVSAVAKDVLELSRNFILAH